MTTHIKMLVALCFAVLLSASPAHAQGQQCRTAPVGTSTANCASEAFVTQTAENLSGICTLFPSTCAAFFGYVDPTWYGALYNGSNCDDVALAAAQTALGVKGGKIVIGPHQLHMCAEFPLASNIILQGQGMDGTTVLDFTSTHAGDGIAIHGTFVSKIRDLQIFGAYGNGIGIYGVPDGLATNPIGLEVGNVRITGVQIGSCIRWGGVITSTYHDIICVGAPTYSYNFASFTTSQHLSNVYSVSAGKSGFNFNDTVYSDCSGCYADSSVEFGYIFTNVNAFHCVPCAGESNPLGLYDAAGSTAIATGSTIGDIRGLVVQPFSFNNGTTGPSCTLLATSLNSVNVDVTLLGGSDLNCFNTISFVMDGAGVYVTQIGGTYLGTKPASAGATFDKFGGKP